MTITWWSFYNFTTPPARYKPLQRQGTQPYVLLVNAVTSLFLLHWSIWCCRPLSLVILSCITCPPCSDSNACHDYVPVTLVACCRRYRCFKRRSIVDDFQLNGARRLHEGVAGEWGRATENWTVPRFLRWA